MLVCAVSNCIYYQLHSAGCSNWYISKQLVIAELHVLPFLEETIKAIGQLRSNKATGVDGILPEAWINGGLELYTKLHELLISCCEQGVVLQHCCDAVIKTLYKKKGDKSECSNYCGITLLSIAGNILARLLWNSVVPEVVEKYLLESQCHFRSN